MKCFGLCILLVSLTMAVGCTKKTESTTATAKTDKKALKNAQKSTQKKKQVQKRPPEVRSLKTHCPPRLSLYVDLVTEYESAAQAQSKGDPKPLAAFGTKLQQVEKMTVGFQRSTLNKYCRTFFNPAVQRFTAASELVAKKSNKQVVDTGVKSGKLQKAPVDPKTMKAANQALKAAACTKACVGITEAKKKAECMAACPK